MTPSRRDHHGSQSTGHMRHAAEMLEGLGVGYEKRIVSAHRTPSGSMPSQRRQGRGHKVIIGAGGAAHLRA